MPIVGISLGGLGYPAFEAGGFVMAEEPHKRVGDYEIVRELGHGGMGQVYLVRNVISDRIEAMKVVLPDLAQEGEVATRFMREIKVLASLEHPNIALLRTAFTADNQLVMIMEYVDGDTLAHGLESGAFSTPDALNYVGQVLAALSYAHSKGIIHRDIKPANMMLTPSGTVKVMDFGIARSSNDLGMTVTGTTLGSLNYMSPEQVKSEPTDARSDLYSVGVSLYEMVTGHRMFGATSSYSVMEAHVKEIPRPPIEVQPTMPQALSDIIMMAVAKDPAHRFQTAEAFRNALSQVSAAATPAAAAVVVAANAASPQTPGPQAVPMTPPPAMAAPIVRPDSNSNAAPPEVVRDGRHIGWLLAVAILVLVAVFGGAQAYRSHQRNEGLDSTLEIGSKTSTTTAPVLPAPQPMPPANHGSDTSAQNQTSIATSSPETSPPPVPSRHSPKGGQPNQQATLAPPPAAPNQPSAEDIAAQKKLLDDMETEFDQLGSRAAAVESSMDAMEQQMHQSGLGLRSDMVAARSNMRNDLAKAKQAQDGYDSDRARKFLDQANHELQKLEAFVGGR